jgi:hypothetical protein
MELSQHGNIQFFWNSQMELLLCWIFPQKFKQNPPSNPTAVTSSMMSWNQVYFQFNCKVARNLEAKLSANWTVPECSTIFSSSTRHSKRPPWRHQWCHRTKLVYFHINSRVGRKLHTKFGVDPTISEFSTTFSSKIRDSIWLPHPIRLPWRHWWYHRTKFTFRLIPRWQGTSTPSLAWMGQF